MQSWNDSSSSPPSPFVRRVGLWGLWVVAGLAVALGPASVSRAAAEAPSLGETPDSFAELLAGFAKTTGLEARFEEEKSLALLAVPLRSRGRLYFSPPSTLLRRVEEPERQDVLVVGDRVRISDAEGEQTLDLAARNEVRPLVESMLWIFTGDLEALERTYRVAYEVEGASESPATNEVDKASEAPAETSTSGEAPRWQVHLVPKDEPLSSLVEELRVSGTGGVADTLELVETSGDRTLTRILDANPRRSFDAKERRALFGTGEP